MPCQFKIHHLPRVVAVLAFFTLASPVFAQTFTGLGDLPGGSTYSRAYGISADGSVVVGESKGSSDSEAFRWTAAGGMIGLGDLEGGFTSSSAYAVSADGSAIVGRGSSDLGTEAYRWTIADGMVGLGDLEGGSFLSNAYGISSDGSLVVGSGRSTAGTEAFRWLSSGGMVGLGDLPGGDFSSTADEISADGSVIIGSSNTFKSSEVGYASREAFRWTAGEGMVVLEDLPGGQINSRAADMTFDGSLIVGYGNGDNGSFAGQQEATLWTSPDNVVGLGDLPGGQFKSAAAAVTSDGSVIVGSGTGNSGLEAILWTEGGGMNSLSELLVNNLGMDLTGWTLTNATGVSDNGRVIIGNGTSPAGIEGWVAKIESLSLGWTGSGSGNWDSLANWTYGLRPGQANQDDLSINPVGGVAITGPVENTIIDSLTIGTQTNGVAELSLQAELTINNALTIQDRGQLTLSGQVIAPSAGVTIDGTGKIAGYGLIVGTISGTAGVNGIIGSGGSFRSSSSINFPVDFGTGNPDLQITVVSRGYADLGHHTILGDGTINATINMPNGLFVSGASILEGPGTVVGKIAVAFGATIEAGVGDLTLGDATSVVGFTSDGELHTNANIVTINDANEAVLGSLTTLGDGTTGGQLTAPNGLLIEQGKNITGRGNIAGDVKNNGHVIGDGTGAGERIVFDSPWVVSGIGTFENTQIDGTFAPGNSTAIVTGESFAFSGTVEIELGGDTPGNGSNNHDQIIDLDTIELLEGVDLAVMPWNGFEPEVGDTFEIILSDSGIVGSFDDLIVDAYFAQLGIDFELFTTSDSISLLAVAVGIEGDFDADSDVDGNDFLAWQRGESTTPLSSGDLATWQDAYGQSAQLAASSTTVPEPTSGVLLLLAAVSLAASRRKNC